MLEERNPYATAPTVGIVPEEPDEGFMQLCEGENIWLQEAIRQENRKLCKLKEYLVRLRRKSRLLDAKINKLETKIMQACCTKELRMTRQDAGSHTTTLEDGHQELVALLPLLRQHLTRQSNWGSAPHKEECKALTVVRVIEECLQNGPEGELKTRIGGVTT